MSDIFHGQKDFYSNKFEQFGDEPRSLSYNSEITHNERFNVILRLFKYESGNAFSLHDVGCGLAHLNSFLIKHGINCQYSGSDILEGFIDAAAKKFPDCQFTLQNIGDDLDKIQDKVKDKDYYVAGGIFNLTGNADKNQWEAFVFKAMSNMFAMAKKAIAVDFLTTYSDFYADDLYYADPCRIYDWCKKNLSRFVTIISDGPLYEFMLLVYKEDFIHSQYLEGFEKYFKNV